MTDTQQATLALPPQVCETINTSMMGGMPVLVTYWDDKGAPSTSWRGSTHVHPDGRLAIWIRARQGGLQWAIQTNSTVRLAYRNPHTASFVLFEGQAKLEQDDAENRAIFDASPPMEQAQDPERKGIGLVIAVNSAKGVLNGEQISLAA